MHPQALVAIALIGLGVAGCSRTMPVYNVTSAPVAAPSQQAAAQAQGAIIQAKSAPLGASNDAGSVIPASTAQAETSEVDVAISDAKTGQLSAAQVHDAIIEAATDRGWIVKEDDPGRILLEIFVRQHSAMVTVDYSPTAYDITYTDSELLMYDGSNIHRNYNQWVKLLEQQINRRLAEA
jgi:hypothetical protein